jgi:glycosyltransferase involved in cell wall biosynthesis
MNPKVSVLMPNYNCEKYIEEAIQSILDQSFTDFEFIIIDDASTDKSWEIIMKYAKIDKRIVPLRNDKNSKICKTLNN